jgi:hypothetical protein
VTSVPSSVPVSVSALRNTMNFGRVSFAMITTP